jgi:hypothetical protein
MIKGFILAVIFSISSLSLASAKSVQFDSPKDGDTVSQHFKAKFSVKGMTVKPAGQALDDKSAGHFHIIVDGPAVAEGTVIPADPSHLHYGKGQTEADLALAPGPHTLTLQLADGLHKAYGSDLTKTIHITVK